MVALGWVNIARMGLFAEIIIGEKYMVKRNIDSGFTGIAFAIIGILTLLGISTLYNDTMDMDTKNRS